MTLRISVLGTLPFPGTPQKSMTKKESVLDAISELPDEASLDEIAERVDFLAAIQKGLDQLDRGEGIPHEEVKRQLATWLTS
jgi:predicted transcriptional regulator